MPLPKSIDPNSPDSNYLGGGSRVHGIYTLTDAYFTLWASPRTATGKYQTVLHLDMIDGDDQPATLDLKQGNPGSPKFPCFPTLDGDNPVVGTADDMRALANGERGMLSPDELAAYRAPYVNTKFGDRAGQFLRSLGAATTKDGKKFTWPSIEIGCIAGLKVDIGEVASDNPKDKKDDGTPWMVPVVLSIVELPGSKPAAGVAKSAAAATASTNGAPANDLTPLVEKAVAQFALDKGGTVKVNPKGVGALALHVHKTLMGDAATKAYALNGSKMPTAAWLLAGDRPWIADTDANTITVLGLPEAS